MTEDNIQRQTVTMMDDDGQQLWWMTIDNNYDRWLWQTTTMTDGDGNERQLWRTTTTTNDNYDGWQLQRQMVTTQRDLRLWTLTRRRKLLILGRWRTCCSYSIKVKEEEEKEVATIQKHNKSTSKRNLRNSKLRRRETMKNLLLSTLNNREHFF
jgi:hypothetical protein